MAAILRMSAKLATLGVLKNKDIFEIKVNTL